MLDLKDYIGLKCVVGEPTSGKFVDDLEGISTELVHSLQESDMASFGELWRKVETRAIDNYINDIKLTADELGNYHEQFYESQRLNIQEPRKTIGNENSLYGLKIEIPYSPNINIELSDLTFYSLNTDAVEGQRNVVIHDLITGDQVYQSDAFTAVEGLNKVSIDITLEPQYQKISYFIGINVSGLDLLQSKEDCYQPRNTHDRRYYDDCGCYDNEEFDIYPSKCPDNLTIIQENNLVKRESGYGVAVNFKAECSIEKYIDDNLKEFCISFWYYVGAELLKEKLSSLNTNYFAVTDLERTEYVKNQLIKKAKDSMKRVLKSAPLDSLCYDCYGKNIISWGWQTL